MPAIDFSEVKGIEPVPAGSYPATIVAAEEGISQNNNTKIDLQWKLETGEKGTDGRIIFDVLTFTEKAMFRVKNTLLGLGYPKNYSGEISAEELVGKSAMLTVDIQTSTQTDEDGEPYPPRNRVKKVRPIESASSARRARRG